MNRSNPDLGSARITIVIPNWNGLLHLAECLNSLRSQEYRNFEVVLVDNLSSDRSLEFVRKEFPEVKVIELTSNRGFSAAVNAGIQASSSEFIVLLNSDTRVDTGWLKKLVEAMDETPRASFGVSKMLLYDQPDLIDAAGDGYSWAKGAGVQIGAGKSRNLYSRRSWVFGACAGSAIYRRALFEDIGLFDEDFFLIFEDVDIDMRAQVAGHSCLYVPDSVVYHKRGSTFDGQSPEVVARAIRNRIWVAGKSLPLPLLVLWTLFFLPRTAAVLLFRLLRYRAPHKGGLKTEALTAQTGVWDLYRQEIRRALRELPAKRREVKPLRKRGSLEMLKVLNAKHRTLKS